MRPPSAFTHTTTMHFIATDTETGGLYPSIHALLSIGACCSWSPETFQAYITVDSQPGKTVDPEAAKKNGYTREKWEALGARPLADVLADFLAWIVARKTERHLAKVICHNLAFDRSYFSEAERHTGLAIPHRHDWRCSQVKLGELMDNGLIEHGSAGLDRLIELSGWQGQRRAEHDALQDAQATLHGYAWLLDKAKTPEVTLRHLYNQCLMDRKNLEAFIVSVQEAVHELLSERDQQRPITKASIHAELAALVANLSEKKEGRVDA
jgi:DNA polymerase III epsilon subunit-like protein